MTVFFCCIIFIIIVTNTMLIGNLKKFSDNSLWLKEKEKDFKYYPVNEAIRSNLYRNGVTNEKLHLTGLDCDSVLRTCSLKASRFDADSCTYCNEPNAKCVRYDEPIKIVTIDKKTGAMTGSRIYDVHENADLGYCTPVFSNASKVYESSSSSSSSSGSSSAIASGDGVIRLDPCNTNTGDRVLVKPHTEVVGYKISCLCKYPEIISQTILLDSDCDVPTACSGGKLIGPDWRDPTRYVNIIDELSCDRCISGTFPDRDPITNHPVCRKSTFAEHSSESYDETVYPKNIALLNVTDDAIEPTFREKFGHPQARKVPDPCAFDAFTFVPFAHSECLLTHTPDKSIYFCRSNDVSVATLQYDDDYLKGNTGRFGNGCYRFTNDKSDIDYIVGEYYNRIPSSSSDTRTSQPRAAHPIVGYAIKRSKIMMYNKADKFLDIDNVE